MATKSYCVTVVRTIEEVARITVEAPNKGHAAFLAGQTVNAADGVEWQKKSEKLDVTHIGADW